MTNQPQIPMDTTIAEAKRIIQGEDCLWELSGEFLYVDFVWEREGDHSLRQSMADHQTFGQWYSPPPGWLAKIIISNRDGGVPAEPVLHPA